MSDAKTKKLARKIRTELNARFLLMTTLSQELGYVNGIIKGCQGPEYEALHNECMQSAAEALTRIKEAHEAIMQSWMLDIDDDDVADKLAEDAVDETE